MRFVFAYLDPGSGSIIIQAVIAGIVALPIVFRSRVSAFIRRLRGGGTPASGDRPDDAAR